MIFCVLILDMSAKNVVSYLWMRVMSEWWDAAGGCIMIVGRNQFRKSILHSQSSIESSRLVTSCVEVAPLDRMFHQWRLKIMTSVIHRVTFPILRNDLGFITWLLTRECNWLCISQFVIVFRLKLLPCSFGSSICIQLTFRPTSLQLTVSPLLFGIEFTLNSLNLLLNMTLFTLLLRNFLFDILDQLTDRNAETLLGFGARTAIIKNVWVFRVHLKALRKLRWNKIKLKSTIYNSICISTIKYKSVMWF